jgi:hypothetical protein
MLCLGAAIRNLDMSCWDARADVVMVYRHASG